MTSSPQHDPVNPSAPGGHWLLIGDRGGIAMQVEQLLTAKGESVTVLDAEKGWEPLRADALAASLGETLAQARKNGRVWRGVVYLRGLDLELPVLREEGAPRALVGSAADVIRWVQALERLGGRDRPRLWLVTRGSQCVGSLRDETVCALQAPLWGLGQVLAYEAPSLRCTRVDLAATPESNEARLLVDELLGGTREDQVALRRTGRHVARLENNGPLTTSDGPLAEPSLDANGSYLVATTLNAFGLNLLRWLVDRGATQIALLAFGSEGSDAARTMRELAALGVRVVHMNVSEATAKEFERIVSAALMELSPLRGVLLTLPRAPDQPLAELAPAVFAARLWAKVMPAWVLDKLTSDLPLEFFCVYTSSSALVACSGQAADAAANAFLDALCLQRSSRGQHGASVAWAPCEEDAPDEEGQLGLGTISAKERELFLDDSLRENQAQAAIAKFHARHWVELFPSAAGSPYFSGLLNTTARDGGSVLQSAGLRDQVLSCAEEERSACLGRLLREQVGQVLRAPGESLDLHAPLTSLGMDSFMGLELRNRLERGFGVTLPSTLVWTYPSLDAVGRHLAELLGLSGEPQERVVGTEESPSDGNLVALLADLSEGEKSALLQSTLEMLEANDESI